MYVCILAHLHTYDKLDNPRKSIIALQYNDKNLMLTSEVLGPLLQPLKGLQMAWYLSREVTHSKKELR